MSQFREAPANLTLEEFCRISVCFTFAGARDDLKSLIYAGVCDMLRRKAGFCGRLYKRELLFSRRECALAQTWGTSWSFECEDEMMESSKWWNLLFFSGSLSYIGHFINIQIRKNLVIITGSFSFSLFIQFFSLNFVSFCFFQFIWQICIDHMLCSCFVLKTNGRIR